MSEDGDSIWTNPNFTHIITPNGEVTEHKTDGRRINRDQLNSATSENYQIYSEPKTSDYDSSPFPMSSVSSDSSSSSSSSDYDGHCSYGTSSKGIYNKKGGAHLTDNEKKERRIGIIGVMVSVLAVATIFFPTQIFGALGKAAKGIYDPCKAGINKIEQVLNQPKAPTVVKESGTLVYDAETNSDIMNVNRMYSNGSVEKYGYEIPLDVSSTLEDKRDTKLYEKLKKSDEYKESLRKQFNEAGSETAPASAASAVETSEIEFTSAAAFAEYSATQALNNIK